METMIFLLFSEVVCCHITFLSYYFSVGLIVLGAFIAGARDLSFDAYGYGIVFLANITTAICLATIARIGDTSLFSFICLIFYMISYINAYITIFLPGKFSGLNSFELMWCNGILCGPILLFWTYVRGDMDLTFNFPYLLSPGFLFVAHMPWRQMTYKFLKTIIDDLFAFVINMPTLHRLLVFRDECSS
ncbi:UDP-N-acetylglucosamine transporter UGNT1-like isoform X1 [Spinacia oleracea]|uniref:UDP-N-acetylglucosamine transporter UGNT1-like isoform X1 n=1 Tax=Spinacia oleracea TaxID=3562 RepID=A0ABM3RMJ1_SPIOL|nr:UDP-N-acetylglucosamine transporter UGNT1-like isoform X1 [Spinacia oleracea]